MSMKVGNQGDNLWPQFHELGVAAITYAPVMGIDFRNYSQERRPLGWNNLSSTQKGSLDALAYEFKRDDIIYVKDGLKIVAKGIVFCEYYYDGTGDVIDRHDLIWPHRVKVKWMDLFPDLSIRLGAEQNTVLKLNDDKINLINRELDRIGYHEADDRNDQMSDDQKILYEEGRRLREEQYFSKRNHELITRKKRESDYSCEVCGLNFIEKYGDIGIHFIEAHHLERIANGARLSSLNDIALVCSNCHSMLHRKNPPYKIAELKNMINVQRIKTV